MKNLIIWAALVFIFTNANGQQPSEPQVTTNATYALNTTPNINLNADVNLGGADKQDDDPSRTKNITKTFPADQSDKINLGNQYGSMTIKVWNRREVKIDIAIVAYSNSEKGAQSLIDQVNIEAEKNGDNISCKTTIDRDNQWSGRNRRREVKVNYVVYVPASNALTLSQQYGNVNIGDFSGPLSASVQYGDLNAGNLSGTNNYINVQYGKTTIEGLNKAVIKQQYGSGLTIGTVGDLELTAQYVNVDITTIKRDATIKQQYGSGIKIGSVNNLDLTVQYATANLGTIRGNAVIKQQYNSLTIGSVGKLDLKSGYAGVTIGTLRGDGNFKSSYNHFSIAEVAGTCRNLNIDADYADVSLNFANNYNGDFTVEKHYGGFRYGDNVKATLAGGEDERRDSSTKNYSGKIGNGGNASVKIRADYGSVVFK